MSVLLLKKYIAYADNTSLSRGLFISVLISGIAAAGYFLWLLNTYWELVTLQQHFRQLQHQYQQQVLLPGQQDEPELSARLNTLLQGVSRKEQLSAVTELLAAEIQQADLQLQQIQWLPEQESALYKQQPLVISLHGNYHQFGKLLHALSRQPVLLGWHEFSVRSVTDKELALQLTLSIYHSLGVLPGELTEPGGQIPEPESYFAHSLQDPFAATKIKIDGISPCHREAGQSHITAAEHKPFLPEQLFFRGVLQDGLQSLAVVEDQQQRLHLIGLATTKELFGGEVLSVTHDVLEIRDWISDTDGCLNPRITRFTLAGAL